MLSFIKLQPLCEGDIVSYSQSMFRWEEGENLLWESVGVRDRDMISTKLEERMRL